MAFGFCPENTTARGIFKRNKYERLQRKRKKNIANAAGRFGAAMIRSKIFKRKKIINNKFVCV